MKSPSILLLTLHHTTDFYALRALEILQTFGFAGFLQKPLHPHVWAGPEDQKQFVQAQSLLIFVPLYDYNFNPIASFT